VIIFDNKSSLLTSELSTVIVLVTEDSRAICYNFFQENKTLLSIELLADLSEIDTKFSAVEDLHIRLATPNFTLVPKILVNTDNNAISNFNFEIYSNSTRAYTYTYDEKMAILYNLTEKERNTFQKASKYPIQHFTKELIAFVSKNSEDHFLIVIIGNQLFVSLQLNQKIQLMNAYPVSSIDEVLYYCMLIVQEYSLNPSSIKLTTVGDFTEKGLLYKSLSDYFINVQPLHSEDIKDARYSGFIKLLMQ
jgi:hypothetical protein